MSIRKTILGALLALTVTGAAMPSMASADRGWHRGHDRYRGYDRHDDRYEGRRGYYADRGYDGRRGYRGDYRGNCRRGGTTGLLLGGAAGALLGRSIDTRGDRAPGTIIGAGAGALLGREIERGSHC